MRGAWSAWYKSAAWRRARAVFLADHPRCAVPGCPVAPTRVDHATPHRGDPVRFWDQANWQPLCLGHHNAKTAAADGGFGNPRRAGATVRLKGCAADGTPLDPTHPWNRR